MSSVFSGINDPRSLIGTWDFARTIADHRAGPGYTASGRAVLEPIGDTIRWHEDGLLRRDGGEYPVMRTLRLRPDAADGGRWNVEFDDGRPFHEWTPDSPLVHACGADTYRGRVTVVDSDTWSLDWAVSGPAKDYTLTTTYSRQRTRHQTIA